MPRPLWQRCLAPSLTFFFTPSPSVPILSDMRNMLSHLGLTERKRREGRDNTRQRRVEGSSGRRERNSHTAARTHTHTHTHTHTCDMSQAPNINVGAVRMMPLQGDSVIRRVYYTVAPVQHGARYLPHPYLFSSVLPPLINLGSDCPQDSLVLIRGGKYVYDACTLVQTHTHTHTQNVAQLTEMLLWL